MDVDEDKLYAALGAGDEAVKKELNDKLGHDRFWNKVLVGTIIGLILAVIGWLFIINGKLTEIAIDVATKGGGG